MMPNNPNARSLLRTESSDSASVTWLDRRAARKATEEAAAKLKKAHPEIVGVLLFGSIARGDAVPGSDLDLIIVLAEADRPFLDRIPYYTPAVAELSVDVLAYTEAEIAEMYATGRPIILAALAEGDWLIGPPGGLDKL